MFLESFKITGLAVTRIFILGAIGYFLVKKNILGQSGLDNLSRLVVEVTLPLLIFCQLIKDFSFTLYPNWWVFPLISIAITVFGLAVGLFLGGFVKGQQGRLQFLSLIAFQNSGYLPLALVAALLPKGKIEPMFIYLFLFLLGFNLVIWSFGVYMLSFSRNNKFAWASLFSPPVLATLFSLALIFLGINKTIPDFIFMPLKSVGDCTLPLAMFVVGGCLAQIRLDKTDVKPVFLMVLGKLIILPALGLLLIIKLRMPDLMGLLIIMQLAMPPATSLSVIIRNYNKEDLLISQGVFWGHILSIVSIPIFLSLYFTLSMIE
ncbi:MAG: AEC family transporter [Candidatus Omnitrophota bacterium]